MKKWFENLKISKKIVFGFLVTIFIALAVATIGVISIRNVSNNGTLLYKENTLGLSYLGSAYANFNNVRYTSLRLTSAETAAEKSTYAAKINDLCAGIDDLLKNMKAPISHPRLPTSIKIRKRNGRSIRPEFNRPPRQEP